MKFRVSDSDFVIFTNEIRVKMDDKSAFDLNGNKSIGNLDVVEDIYGDELDAIGDRCQTVTSIVRHQYLLYLRKTLIANYRKRLTVAVDHVIEAAIDALAGRLERQALVSCMVFPVYQKAMLTNINSVRDATNGGKAYCPAKFERALEEQRREWCQMPAMEKQTMDAAVQANFVEDTVTKSDYCG